MLNALPNWDIPYRLHADPIRAKARKLWLLPMCMHPRTLNTCPAKDCPKMLSWDPSRTNDRQLRLLPIEQKSSRDRLLPNRASP
jgi:hypothetical protein